MALLDQLSDDRLGAACDLARICAAVLRPGDHTAVVAVRSRRLQQAVGDLLFADLFVTGVRRHRNVLHLAVSRASAGRAKVRRRRRLIAYTSLAESETP